MMEIEKKLALKDLKTFHEDQRWKTLAIEIVKYQNFKVKKAIEHLSGDWNALTKVNYFNKGVKYIRSNIRDSHVSSKLFNFIDEAIAKHTQPLTPSVADKARPRRTKATKPTKPVFDIPQQLTEPCQYGIQKDNVIILMPNEQSVVDFINTNNILNHTDNVVGVVVTIDTLQKNK